VTVLGGKLKIYGISLQGMRSWADHFNDAMVCFLGPATVRRMGNGGWRVEEDDRRMCGGAEGGGWRAEGGGAGRAEGGGWVEIEFFDKYR
jgi:hypothetical protein